MTGLGSMLMETIKFLAGIYLLLVLFLFIGQRHLIFHPTDALEHPFQTLKLPQLNHEIHAIQVNPDAKDVILYFGGNAEQVVYSAHDLAQRFPNHASHLLYYRGYAGAPGKPSEAALYADALALYDHIQSLEPASITVIGRSLGSAVATHLAANRPINQLVLVTPFDSILNVAKGKFPWAPVSWLLRDHFDSASNARQVSVPTLIVMAEHDELIPTSHTLALQKAFPQTTNTELTAIGSGHNDIDLNHHYFRHIKQFIGSGRQ